MSSTPSQHVKRCPHMGHSQTKSQAPRLGVGKPGLWIWLLAGCLETPQTQGGGNWTWVLCFPDGFFLQVSRHSEHSFWFSPHPVGHPPAHSAWQRAQGLTASPSATLWLSATPWLVPPPPSCPGRGASPTRACPPPSLPRQSGISHQGLSAPFLAQAERHLPQGPVSPHPSWTTPSLFHGRSSLSAIRAMVATLPGPPALAHARASGGPPSSCYHLPGSTSDLSGDTLALQPAPTLLFAPLTGLRTFQGLGSHGSWRHQCLA